MSQPPNQIPALFLTRVVPAPPARVFAAWTTPDAIKAWFGPPDCEVLAAQIDLRVGGEYRFVILSEQLGKVSVRGQYQEVTPPAKLIYTWRWEGSSELIDATSLVTVEFVPAGSATEIRLTHEQLPTPESRDSHGRGWNGALQKFVQYLGS